MLQQCRNTNFNKKKKIDIEHLYITLIFDWNRCRLNLVEAFGILEYFVQEKNNNYREVRKLCEAKLGENVSGDDYDCIRKRTRVLTLAVSWDTRFAADKPRNTN